MHRYHIHFMSINEDSDKANRHTRQVETLDPKRQVARVVRSIPDLEAKS